MGNPINNYFLYCTLHLYKKQISIMKNNLEILILFMLLVLSCNNNVKDSCEYTGCDPQRQTIKIAYEAKGRVEVFSQKFPDLWVIVSEEGIIGDNNAIFDGPDVVIICNLPDSMKIMGRKVIFSGELKSSCEDFERGLSEIYYCSPNLVSFKE